MCNKIYFSIILVLFVLLTVSSCGDNMNDEPIIDLSGQALQAELQPDTLRLLAIGNSFSGDALAFLPFMLQQISPRTHVVVGILHQSGAQLSWQLSAFKKDADYDAYYKWTPERGMWFKQSFTNAWSALSDEHWDFVTLQQASLYSVDYTTISPYLQPMAEQLRELGYNGKLAWIITPAYPDGARRLSSMNVNGKPVTTSDEMFQAIGKCAMQVMQNPNLDLVLPCGTALQNARHTSLNNYANSLSSDGVHLQSGIPMFVESCAAAMALLHTAFTRCHVNMNQNMYKPLSRGSQVGMSSDNQDLAVRCAGQAFNSPFEATLY